MGKKAAPPPDYQSLAKQQGTENRDTAKYNAELNRVNQLTPYGSLTWTNKPTLNKAAYDAAVQKNQNAEALYLQANPDVAAAVKAGTIKSGLDHYAQYGKKEGRQGYFEAPQESDFMTENWTQIMDLDPAQQKLLDQQNALSEQYGQLAGEGMSRVGEAMAKPMDMSGLPEMKGAPTAGPLAGASDASRFQTERLNPTALANAMPTPGAVGASQVSTSFDTSGVRKLPGQIDDTSRRRVEEALMSRLNPQYQQDEQALRTRLLNSGIEVGTDAYNREMANHSQRLNDARMQAILAGGQEESRQVGLQSGLQAQEFGQAQAKGQFAQTGDIANANNNLQAGMFNTQMSQQNARDRISNLLAAQGLNLQTDQANYGRDMASRQFDNATQAQQFQQELAGAQFGNQARQQSLQEQAWLRQLPLNEVNALRTGSQVTGPQFQQYYTSNAQAAPIFDAAMAQNNAAMQQAQINQSGTNALLGGLAMMGGAYLGKPSDIRLKKNIKRIGDHPAGVGRYSWDWKDGSGSAFGVLAQELQGVRPDAVRVGANGFLEVNYGVIGGE